MNEKRRSQFSTGEEICLSSRHLHQRGGGDGPWCTSARVKCAREVMCFCSVLWNGHTQIQFVTEGNFLCGAAWKRISETNKPPKWHFSFIWINMLLYGLLQWQSDATPRYCPPHWWRSDITTGGNAHYLQPVTSPNQFQADWDVTRCVCVLC